MKLEDTFRMLCSAYYGVREMDEYLLNRLKITKDEREIGMLINTQNLSEADLQTSLSLDLILRSFNANSLMRAFPYS